MAEQGTTEDKEGPDQSRATSSFVRSPRQTAGPGFSYEDEVVAYFFLHMLRGSHPFRGIDHPLSKISAQQTKAWPGFDDVVLSFGLDFGVRCAFSIKSSPQVTSKSMASDFVHSAWEILLGEAGAGFDVKSDWLGLICPPHDALKELQTLIPYAEFQGLTQLEGNIKAARYVRKATRELFNSFRCPDDLAEKLSEDSQSAKHLLGRLRVLPLDLNVRDSAARGLCLQLGQEVVVEGTHEASEKLWAELCQLANSVRISGGDRTRDSLVESLRDKVSLRGFPDFSDDLRRIREASLAMATGMRSVIGEDISIDRTDQVDTITRALDQAKAVALVGSSGCGKSALVRRAVEAFGSSNQQLLWIDASGVTSGYLEALAVINKLANPIHEVLKSARHLNGMVIIDQAEKLAGESAFAEISRLLSLLGCGLGGSATWRLLTVCRNEAWDRVEAGIASRFEGWIPWKPVLVEAPKPADLSPVWKRFPNIRTLASRPHLTQLLCNLKILDSVATSLLRGHELPAVEWAGEAQLIDWFWEGLVQREVRGTERSAFLQRLAADLADRGSSVVGESELLAGELPLVTGLSEIIRYDSSLGTVAFAHDLYADWSRFRLLRSRRDALGNYIEDRLNNPHWLGALRLLGIEALDCDVTGSSWRALLNEFPEMRDLLLEALVFTYDQERCLEAVWPALTEQDGVLLRDLLKRFRYVSSMPNPQYMKLAMEVGMSDFETRTRERLPMWPYWIPFLRFLSRHQQEVVRMALFEAAELTHSWLYYAPPGWPGRKEAASLALASAWSVHKSRPHAGGHAVKESYALCYRAALEGYPDDPEEVALLARKAAARVVPEADDGEAFEVYEPPGTTTEDPMLGGKVTVPEPWDDGPFFRVNEPFANACLFSDALTPIIEEAPQLAQELILACLIESRSAWDQLHGGGLPGFHEAGLSNESAFWPAFYSQGPFLRFLNQDPEAALDTIIRLVDFATDRQIEALRARDETDEILQVSISSVSHPFVGDDHVYHWYRGAWGVAPVASALMAVEKWLYGLIDEGADISRWVKHLLTNSQSLAILGLLSNVGRYHLPLFYAELRSLILCFHVYVFEDIARTQSLDLLGVPPALGESERTFNLKRDWSGMPHRKFKVHEIAAHLFHSDEQLKADLHAAASRWETAVDSDKLQMRDLARYLSAFFNPDNWESAGRDDAEIMEFRAPPEMIPSEEEVRTRRLGLMSYTVPLRCRQLLDERVQLEDESVAQLLNVAKDLSKWEFNATDLPSSPRAPADAVCGIAAVLIILAAHWLEVHPEDKQWCVNVLRETVLAPPPWPPYDMPESVGSCDWEHFVCEAVPFLWAEDPADEDWRRVVGRLVFAKHYDAAGLLMRSCFEVREALGESYWQLVDLMLEWASCRWQLIRASGPDERTEVDTWAKSRHERFSRTKKGRKLHVLARLRRSKATTPLIGNWGALSVERGDRRCAGYRSGSSLRDEYVVEPAIDVRQVRSAFAGSFALNDAANTKERSLFVKFWQQALHVGLSSTRFFDASGKSLPPGAVAAEVSMDFENWVLEQMAWVVSQLELHEKPELLWEPILCLGSSADLRVRRFLSTWFLQVRTACASDRFFDYWRRMAEYALTCTTWEYQGREAREVPGLWLEMLGLPRFSRRIWTESDRSILEAHADLFERALPAIVRGPYETARLLDWSEHAAAQELRLVFFEHIVDFAMQADDSWFLESDLADDFARFLHCLWKKHWREITSSKQRESQYRSILKRLARLSNPIALELQRSMAHRA